MIRDRRPGTPPAGRGEGLEAEIVSVLRTIYDPEIPVNLYDLGLVYALRIDGGAVEIEMTLTAPGCPVAGSLVKEVEDEVGRIAGVVRVRVELTWDPPWSQERMSPDARLFLGLG